MTARKSLTEIKEILQTQKRYLYDKYGVTEIGIFGSYVRGEQDVDSDLDLLVELTDPPRIDLFDLVNLKDYLSKLIGLEVDVTLKQNLRKRIGQHILNEVRPI